MIKTCSRGEIYYADLGDGIGSEQKGIRPVVILQNNTGNKYSPTVIVAPATTKTNKKEHLPTHFNVCNVDGLYRRSVIMLEQIRTIDKQRLHRYIGSLSEKQLEELKIPLEISVGLRE